MKSDFAANCSIGIAAVSKNSLFTVQIRDRTARAAGVDEAFIERDQPRCPSQPADVDRTLSFGAFDHRKLNFLVSVNQFCGVDFLYFQVGFLGHQRFQKNGCVGLLRDNITMRLEGPGRWTDNRKEGERIASLQFSGVVSEDNQPSWQASGYRLATKD